MKKLLETLECKFDEYHNKQLKISNDQDPEYYLYMGKANAIGEMISLINILEKKRRTEKNMKYYFVKSINLPFTREWDIYNNWISNNKKSLIEKIRKDLETEVLLESVKISEYKGFLVINDNKEKWLKICELELI